MFFTYWPLRSNDRPKPQSDEPWPRVPSMSHRWISPLPPNQGRQRNVVSPSPPCSDSPPLSPLLPPPFASAGLLTSPHMSKKARNRPIFHLFPIFWPHEKGRNEGGGIPPPPSTAFNPTGRSGPGTIRCHPRYLSPLCDTKALKHHRPYCLRYVQEGEPRG